MKRERESSQTVRLPHTNHHAFRSLFPQIDTACGAFRKTSLPLASVAALLRLSNHHRAHGLDVHHRLEKLRAGELGKMHEIVADLLYLPSDLLAGAEAQLDDLADLVLENALHRVVLLEFQFAIRKERGAAEEDDKERALEEFHGFDLLPVTMPRGEQLSTPQATSGLRP